MSANGFSSTKRHIRAGDQLSRDTAAAAAPAATGRPPIEEEEGWREGGDTNG